MTPRPAVQVTVGAVLLAAGGGRRFDGPGGAHKLTAVLRGRPLADWAVESVLAAGLDETVVVTGAVPLTLPEGVARAAQPTVGRGPGDLPPARGRPTPGSRVTAPIVVGLADQPFVAARRGGPSPPRRCRSPSPPTTGRRGNPVRSARRSGICCRRRATPAPRRDRSAARPRDRSSVPGQSRRHRHPRGSPTMELVNDFTVNAPIDEAWATLTDVERIAPCLPGAQLTEVEGDTYRGLVKVKVGPDHGAVQGPGAASSSATPSSIGRCSRPRAGTPGARATRRRSSPPSSKRSIRSSTKVTVTHRPDDHGQGRAVRTRRAGRREREAAEAVRHQPGVDRARPSRAAHAARPATRPRPPAPTARRRAGPDAPAASAVARGEARSRRAERSGAAGRRGRRRPARCARSRRPVEPIDLLGHGRRAAAQAAGAAAIGGHRAPLAVVRRPEPPPRR